MFRCSSAPYAVSGRRSAPQGHRQEDNAFSPGSSVKKAWPPLTQAHERAPQVDQPSEGLGSGTRSPTAEAFRAVATRTLPTRPSRQLQSSAAKCLDLAPKLRDWA